MLAAPSAYFLPNRLRLNAMKHGGVGCTVKESKPLLKELA